MIAAMAVAAGAAFAETAPITSANVVGFFTKAQRTTDDFKVISFQWDTVAGASTKNLQEAIKPTMATKAWASEDDDFCIPGWTDHAPAIQIRDANGGYDYAWYASNGYDDDSGELYPAWCSADGYVIKDINVSIGQAAWILNQTEEDGEYTVCGAVASEEVAVGGKADVYLLQGGAFPVAFDINDADAVTWTLTGALAWASEDDDFCIPGWTDNAPAIQIRDENGGYDYAWYSTNGYDDDSGTLYPGWCSADGYILKGMVVPVGAGFWLWAPAENPNVFVTVKNPVK